VRGSQQGHPRRIVGDLLGYPLRQRIDLFVWVAGNCVDGDVSGGMAEAGCSDTDCTRRWASQPQFHHDIYSARKRRSHNIVLLSFPSVAGPRMKE
jgi:hypothetical protein